MVDVFSASAQPFTASNTALRCSFRVPSSCQPLSSTGAVCCHRVDVSVESVRAHLQDFNDEALPQDVNRRFRDREPDRQACRHLVETGSQAQRRGEQEPRDPVPAGLGPIVLLPIRCIGEREEPVCRTVRAAAGFSTAQGRASGL